MPNKLIRLACLFGGLAIMLNFFHK